MGRQKGGYDFACCSNCRFCLYLITRHNKISARKCTKRVQYDVFGYPTTFQKVYASTPACEQHRCGEPQTFTSDSEEYKALVDKIRKTRRITRSDPFVPYGSKPHKESYTCGACRWYKEGKPCSKNGGATMHHDRGCCIHYERADAERVTLSESEKLFLEYAKKLTT